MKPRTVTIVAMLSAMLGALVATELRLYGEAQAQETMRYPYLNKRMEKPAIYSHLVRMESSGVDGL